MHNHLLTSWLLIVSLALPACGQTPSPVTSPSFKPRAEALYQQCESLDKGTADAQSLIRDIESLKSADVNMRIQAAERLAGSCDRRAVLPLTGMLKNDKSPLARAAASQALGQLGDREMIDPLLEAIADPDWQVRAQVGRALCSFQVHRASYDVLNTLVNPLNTPLGDEGDLFARCQGILVINQLHDVNFSRKAVQLLLGFLDLDKPAMREIAVATMYELKKTRNGPHELNGLLKQSLIPDFRIKAAQWLGRLGIEGGREALVQAAANDRDPAVRDAATAALAQLKSAENK